MTSFDPNRLLDLEARTGVREDDISDFLRKTEEVEKAIKGMMDGTVDPGSIKIPGLESEEEKAILEAERQKRLEESRRKAEELRLKRKLEERERWWAGAELMTAKPAGGGNEDNDDDDDDSTGKRAVDNRSAILQRYTADYSRWNEWVPSDPATLQEDAELKESEERKKNEEFEKNNPEFCEQFIGDMKERNKSMQKKRDEAEVLRNKGNRHFKRKEYSPQALDAYMESLKVLPYETKTLTNIAQVHIKLGQLDDALDFLGRTLALEPAHVKALSRQAFVLGQQKHFETALKSIAKAIKHDSASGGSNSEDLLAQQHELEIMAKEEGDEEALRNMLGPVTPAPSDANLSASHAAVKSSLLTDFEVADSINAALGAALEKPPTALSDLLAALQGHIFDKDKKKNLFDDLVARCGSNAMIKVHARTSGLLQLSVDFCVAAAGLLADAGEEDAAPASSDAVVAVTSALHFVTIAVGAERASKLVLLEQSTTLPALRSLLGCVKDPDIILAAANLFFVCCADDACKKTQLAVLSDRKLVLLLATALGELLSRAKPHKKNAEEDGEVVALSKACVACAVLIKEISFSEPGKVALAHAEVGCAVCSLSSMLFHYAYSLQWEAHQALESALEALLGLSQVEVLRGFFAVACPVGPGGSVTASCVEVVLRHVLQRPTKKLYSSTCLAVLMNACLDPEGAVRSVVFAHGGMDEALKGLKLGLLGGKDSDAVAASATPIPQQAGLVSRQAGLMSRLATVEGVQAVLYQPDNYRLICRGISQKIDLEGKAHLVRTLAALSQPPEKCRAVALEEHLVEALLDLFPRPREELGEITPQSVVLQPASPASSVLLGNAARCLMPYADDAAHAAVLYKRRNLAGVEKLINAMATCTDIRVRKNLAILLAKGCRIEGIKDLVSHFRGMQMLTELQDKLVK